jgi:hypothetical protein
MSVKDLNPYMISTISHFCYCNRNQSTVLSLGNKVVTDVTANNGVWTFLCAQWSSLEGRWAIFQDAVIADEGKGLSKGESIQGDILTSLKLQWPEL